MTASPYDRLANRAMARKLAAGEALDVDVEGTPVQGFPGVWILARFVDDVDYCSAGREVWIWSIGRHANGAIYASIDTRFYDNPAYECLFLR